MTFTFGKPSLMVSVRGTLKAIERRGTVEISHVVWPEVINELVNTGKAKIISKTRQWTTLGKGDQRRKVVHWRI